MKTLQERKVFSSLLAHLRPSASRREDINFLPFCDEEKLGKLFITVNDESENCSASSSVINSSMQINARRDETQISCAQNLNKSEINLSKARTGALGFCPRESMSRVSHLLMEALSSDVRTIWRDRKFDAPPRVGSMGMFYEFSEKRSLGMSSQQCN